MPAIARRDQVEKAERAHLATDPVCGMSVDPATRQHRREHRGRTYWFCSAAAHASSRPRPEAFLAGARPQPRPAPADAIYTCPMHPEIEQVGPGFCPICGMALEPKTVTLEEGPSAEYARHAPPVLGERRAVAAAAGLGDGRAPARARLATRSRASSAHWLQLALATPVVLWAGWPIFVRCWASFAQAQPEHVDPDRDRRRRRLRLQRGRDAGARDLPGRVPRSRRARSTSTSRPRR